MVKPLQEAAVQHHLTAVQHHLTAVQHHLTAVQHHPTAVQHQFTAAVHRDRLRVVGRGAGCVNGAAEAVEIIGHGFV
jgi:hypothetical protein